jgi:hypothetical protein
MQKELSENRRTFISVAAWLFLGLQAFTLASVWLGAETSPYDLIGVNILPVVVLLSGLTLWRHKKDTNGKILIAAGVFAILVSSMFVL